MTSPSKRKGDRAELEVQALFRDHMGMPARRALGAGRKDDQGDITGLDRLVVQVGNIKRISDALREKPKECERQRVQAGEPFAATFLRLHGGEYRVVLTTTQFFNLYREAIQ